MEMPRNIKWGISTKNDGSMNIRDAVFDDTSRANREIFFAKQGIDMHNIVSANLIHDTNVAVVAESESGQILMNTDGLITDKPNVFLTVTVADCVPIYFYDQTNKIIGLAHAGWRGVVKNITKSMMHKMSSEFGTKSSEVLIYVGPHIQKCHFEIKNDIRAQFDEDAVIADNNNLKVDLLLMIHKQLGQLGVQSSNINFSDECTYCLDNKYFSYRRDKPELVQTMIAYIGIVN